MGNTPVGSLGGWPGSSSWLIGPEGIAGSSAAGGGVLRRVTAERVRFLEPLDEALLPDNDGLDELELIRSRLRNAELTLAKHPDLERRQRWRWVRTLARGGTSGSGTTFRGALDPDDGVNAAARKCRHARVEGNCDRVDRARFSRSPSASSSEVSVTNAKSWSPSDVDRFDQIPAPSSSASVVGQVPLSEILEHHGWHCLAEAEVDWRCVPVATLEAVISPVTNASSSARTSGENAEAGWAELVDIVGLGA